MQFERSRSASSFHVSSETRLRMLKLQCNRQRPCYSISRQSVHLQATNPVPAQSLHSLHRGHRQAQPAIRKARGKKMANFTPPSLSTVGRSHRCHQHSGVSMSTRVHQTAVPAAWPLIFCGGGSVDRFLNFHQSLANIWHLIFEEINAATLLVRRDVGATAGSSLDPVCLKPASWHPQQPQPSSTARPHMS